MITACVKIDTPPQPSDIFGMQMLRIAVRNSNIDKLEVFEDLDLIFNFDSWQSTKRNQHRRTGGILGDFLKRALGMGYASWTGGDNSDSDDDLIAMQWPEPLILRFNGQEYKVFIKVDRNISISKEIEGPSSSKAIDYTEVCVTLPISVLRYNNNNLDGASVFIDPLQKYYNTFKLGKSGTRFEFITED